MDSFQALIPSLVLLSALVIPGLAIAFLLPMARLTRIAVAPLISGAVLAVSTLVSGVWPGTWGGGLVAAVTIAFLALTALVHRFVAGQWRPRRIVSEERISLLACGGAFLCAIVLVSIMYVAPVEGFSSVTQLYDTPFHLSLIRTIIEDGDASSLHAAVFDGTQGSHFYPALWHGWVALAVGLTGASIPVAVHASVCVLAAFIWPLSCGVLAHVILARRVPQALPLTIALAPLGGVMPWGFLTFGPLYSNLLSYSLAPAFVAVAVSFFRRISGVHEEKTPAGVLLCVVGAAFLTTAFSQPNTVFTCGVLVFPALLECLWRVTSSARWPLVARVGLLVSAVAAAGGAWYLIHEAPFMRRTVTWVWPPFASPWRATLDVLSLGMSHSSPQYVLAPVALIGGVLLLRRRIVWPVVSWFMVAVLYILTASVDGVFRDIATGFWYHDSNRLAGAVVLMAVPCVGIAVALVSQFLIERFRLQDRRLVKAPFSWSLVFPVLLVCVLIAGEMWGPHLSLRRYSLWADSTNNETHFLDATEAAFLKEVTATVPAGEVVANNPYDGSVLAFPLEGTHILFKSFPGNWIGTPAPQRTLVAQRLSEVASDPNAICPVLHELNVTHVVRLNNRAETLNYEAESWKGIDSITAETPGFQVVLQKDGLTLYRIAGCGGV